MNYTYTDELYHHGIKGQKWGVRRYQNEDGTYTSLGKERRRTGDGRFRSVSSLIGSAEADKLRAERQKGMAKAKKYSIAAIVGGAAVTAGATYLYSKGYLDEYSLANLTYYGMAAAGVGAVGLNAVKNSKKADTHIQELAEKSEFKTLADIPKAHTDYYKDYFSSDDSDSTELMKDVNPGYPKPGSTQNCMMCTSAMIMRMKGYEVSAGESKTGYPTYMIEDWFEGSEIKRFKPNAQRSAADFNDELKREGDGTYGNLTVRWKNGGGHSILYTVKNGDVHYIDAQVGREYSADQLFSNIDVKESHHTRLNDCEPNDLARGLVSRRPS